RRAALHIIHARRRAARLTAGSSTSRPHLSTGRPTPCPQRTRPASPRSSPSSCLDLLRQLPQGLRQRRVVRSFLLDLLARVDDRGVIPASEGLPDLRKRRVGE